MILSSTFSTKKTFLIILIYLIVENTLNFIEYYILYHYNYGYNFKITILPVV